MTLSTGEKLLVGAIIMISDNFADPTLYANPDKFDPYRYIAAREANAHSNYHVSLTSSHMGFGYGVHACPGRFLATNMIKIALAIMVVKYDWRVWEGAEGKGTKGLRTDMETKLVVFPDAKVELRARGREEREVEVDLLIGEHGMRKE
jgi:cytochrome P450